MEWLNTDTKEHHLVFSGLPYLNLDVIKPNQKLSIQFSMEFTGMRIDYNCAFHPPEQGTIVIYPKDETLLPFPRLNRAVSLPIHFVFKDTNDIIDR